MSSVLRIAQDNNSTSEQLYVAWGEIKDDWESLKNDFSIRERLPIVIHSLAIHPNLPVEVMWEILGKEIPLGLYGLASNISAPFELFTVLRENPNEAVKIKVLNNPACPMDLLIPLPGDKHATVREIVFNPKFSDESISKFLEGTVNPNSNILWSVVCSPNVPVGYAARVLGHLLALKTENPVKLEKVPLSVLVELLKQNYPEVDEEMPRD